MLEFAILGLLHESPLHGYELRKRLNALLGTFRAFSYGSLYPTLRRMKAAGWIGEDGGGAETRATDEEQFGVHFAFFAQTDAEIRLRILEGRRRRVEEKRDGLRAVLTRTRERLDRYTLELQEHGLEAVDREVRWLSELIDNERREQQAEREDRSR